MGIALLFPGQGVQAARMLERLDADPVGGVHVEGLRRHLGVTAERLRALAADGNPGEAVLQPLLTTLGTAAWDAVRQAGDVPVPVVEAGYSLGEITAAAAAGAFDAPTLLALSSARAAAMTAATPGPCAMVALRGLAVDAAVALAAEAGAHIAIVNGPAEVVATGDAASIDRLVTICGDRGAHVRRLDVPVPSHTPLLAGAARDFARNIAGTPVAPLGTPVVSGATGAVITRPEDVRASLAAQIDHRIDWARSTDTVAEMGATVAFEAGPGRSLTILWRERHPEVPVHSIEDFATFAGAARWLLSHP